MERWIEGRDICGARVRGDTIDCMFMFEARLFL